MWKDIEGYEGYYQISSYGNVKNNKGEIIKQRDDKNGYKVVNLSKSGVKKTYKVHRLVGNAFIENPNNLPEINHKDEVKDNNRVENLEWCTHAFNYNYGHRIEKQAAALKETVKGSNNYFYDKHFLGSEHPRSKEVLQMDYQGNVLNVFDCTRSAAESVNCTPAAISAVCRGVRQSAKGFIWKYK